MVTDRDDDPASATVFVVGYNPAKEFSEKACSEKGISHKKYVAALFNDDKNAHRELFYQLHPKQSPTREATQELVRVIGHERPLLQAVIETNVICFSTPKARDIKKPENAIGRTRGLELFKVLVRTIKPRVMIIHGAKAKKELDEALHLNPIVPQAPTKLPTLPIFNDYETNYGKLRIFPIQTLSPRASSVWWEWKSWRVDYYKLIAKSAEEHLRYGITASQRPK